MNLWKLLRKFGICKENSIHYIGGSDVLPPPLKGQEEQTALEALQRGEEQAKKYLGGAQSSAGGLYCPTV